MTIRPRTPSLFRPRKPIDQGVLTENRKLVDDINPDLAAGRRQRLRRDIVT